MRTEIVPDKRVVFEWRDLTEEERAEMKRQHIAEALEWEPPKQTSRRVEIGPDDPRWEDGLAVIWQWMCGSDGLPTTFHVAIDPAQEGAEKTVVTDPDSAV